MKTVIVTGGIGSGKSAVCALLKKRGVPVYDCDAKAKELYGRRPSLVSRLEKALGAPLRGGDGKLDKARLAALIFSDPRARETVEGMVYPILLQDIRRWQKRQSAAWGALESAVILSKPVFDGVADGVVLVEAPQELRIARVMQRDGLGREAVIGRIRSQEIPREKADVLLANDGTPQALSEAVERVFFDNNSYISKLISAV
ncbi:MAG: dephospho-CoA kinase [Bacteroidales bacterium]|nr:dephospho-CoA kinase [Bacteroidales bacterium]